MYKRKSSSKHVSKRNPKRRRRFPKRRFYRTKLPLGGNPRCKMARLRYCEIISLDSVIGGNAQYNFLANDLYDPNSTSTGHQPLGFDQLMAYYDHFTVIGSKITVRVTPTSTSGLVPGIMGIVLSDNGSTVSGSSSVTHLLEGRQTGRNVRWVGDRDRMTTYQMHKSFSHKKFFCKPSHGSEYKGSASGSPTEKAYYEVFITSLNGNDPSAYVRTVTIDYIALFSEPKSIAQS